jgi:hypothetical protein
MEKLQKDKRIKKGVLKWGFQYFNSIRKSYKN